MKLTGPPTVTRWTEIPATTQPGESGRATAHTLAFGDAQARLVHYGAHYVADHWCDKGHIVFVIEGHLTIEYQNGKRDELQAGMSYCVGDSAATSHRVRCETGAKVFIVD